MFLYNPKKDVKQNQIICILSKDTGVSCIKNTFGRETNHVFSDNEMIRDKRFRNDTNQ